jgi:hypothetical protein
VASRWWVVANQVGMLLILLKWHKQMHAAKARIAVCGVPRSKMPDAVGYSPTYSSSVSREFWNER